MTTYITRDSTRSAPTFVRVSAAGGVIVALDVGGNVWLYVVAPTGAARWRQLLSPVLAGQRRHVVDVAVSAAPVRTVGGDTHVGRVRLIALDSAGDVWSRSAALEPEGLPFAARLRGGPWGRMRADRSPDLEGEGWAPEERSA